jgi:hypothetical protein
MTALISSLIRPCLPLLILLAMCLSSSATAQSLPDRIDIHGYGFQDFLQTQGNPYLGGDSRGTWDNNFLGLVLTATVDDRTKVWSQLETSTTGTTHFTWFFVDYQFSDALSGHIGRVKLPLGFYNEFIDAKNLQVSMLEPSLYQDALDFTQNAYQGVGIEYEQKLRLGHLSWELYAGNTYDPDPPANERDRGLLGARLTYTTRIDGLRFMISAARVRDQTLSTDEMTNEDRLMLSGEYVTDRLDFKAEYGLHTDGSAVVSASGTPLGVRGEAYYGQLGYRLNAKWEPYLRYDYATTDMNHADDPSYYQETVVVGIGYQISSNFIVRLEDHLNHGYALPVASGEVVAGTGKIQWNLALAGVTFAF